MFLVGVELNADLVRSRAHAAVATSHASIVAPFVLGSALALFLYPRLSTSNVPFTSFALFMGIAMSITAFPVLARILTDRGISKTELGAVALTCAAADDVTAWCLLALVVGVTQARMEDAIAVSVLTIGYIAMMFLAVRPIVVRAVSRFDDRRPAGQVLALVGVLLSALATEWIGIHAVFGAFLLGAVIPHDSVIARTLTDRLGDVVTILLLPAFFAFTGMRTEIGLISGTSMAAVRPHHPRRHDRQIRRHAGRRPPHRHGLARRGRPGRAHEHARPHGAHRAQSRSRSARHFAGLVHDDGVDGAGDHGCDDTRASVPRPRSRAAAAPQHRRPS